MFGKKKNELATVKANEISTLNDSDGIKVTGTNVVFLCCFMLESRCFYFVVNT